RAEALLMQRSVRENIALPFRARIPRWGVINLGDEKRTVDGAVATLQIDARAGNEVRRLSGGNQQKVTIARWVAGGVRTMVCFDPPRGIDIRTKRQIYALLRDLAEAGAAILLYTSELKEVQLVCDRAIVIFGGKVVREITRAEADEPALLRAAYNLRSDVALPEALVAESVAQPEPPPGAAGGRPPPPGPGGRPPPGAAAPRRPGGGRRSAPAPPAGVPHPGPQDAVVAFARRHAWTLGLLAVMIGLFLFTKGIQP